MTHFLVTCKVWYDPLILKYGMNFRYWLPRTRGCLPSEENFHISHIPTSAFSVSVKLLNDFRSIQELRLGNQIGSLN